jgi:hypothetical protein
VLEKTKSMLAERRNRELRAVKDEWVKIIFLTLNSYHVKLDKQNTPGPSRTPGRSRYHVHVELDQ